MSVLSTTGCRAEPKRDADHDSTLSPLALAGLILDDSAAWHAMRLVLPSIVARLPTEPLVCIRLTNSVGGIPDVAEACRAGWILTGLRQARRNQQVLFRHLGVKSLPERPGTSRPEPVS